MEQNNFPEEKNNLIEPLLSYQDSDLLNLFQQNLEQGKYFVAIFCRHSPLIYTLISHSISSEPIVNYLFSIIWREIFQQLPELKLDELNLDAELQSLSNWLIYITGVGIAKYESISSPSFDKNLPARYLPVKCYLEKSLEQLPPLYRLILVLSENFDWTSEQIVDYLQQQGEKMNILDLEAYLEEGYQMLLDNLPKDISFIYLK